QVRVRAVRTGIAKVTASLPDGTCAHCVITVIDNQVRQTVRRLELNTEKLVLAAGQQAQLLPIFYPKEIYNNGILDKSLVWSSSDEQVAEVQDGTILAHKEGSAVITATSVDVGRDAYCEVVVQNGGCEDFEPQTITMKVGEQYQIQAPTYKKLVWKSDNSYVADVDEQGCVTAYSASIRQVVSEDGRSKHGESDTIRIYATAVEGGEIWEYTVRVEAVELVSPGVFIQGMMHITVGHEQVFTAITFPACVLDQEAVWSSSDEQIIAVTPLPDGRDGSKQVLVKALKTGSAFLQVQCGEMQDMAPVFVIEQELDWLKEEYVPRKGSRYIQNPHLVEEGVTENSALLLWERVSLMHIPEWKEYRIYCNDTYVGSTTKLGYRVENLAPDKEYDFRIEALGQDDEILDMQIVEGYTLETAEQVINVLDYGAKGNGLVNDTYAIQRAINDCPEYGKVWLPEGHVFYCGALFLKSCMTFQVDGIMMAGDDPKDYPQIITRWEGWCMNEVPAVQWPNSNEKIMDCHRQHASLINVGTYCEAEDYYNVENVVICGKGQINGNGYTVGYNQGHDFFKAVVPTAIQNYALRGCLVKIQNAKQVYVKDLQFAYSPSWTLHALFCSQITFDHVHVVTYGDGCVGLKDPGHIFNGDGIDVDSCSHANVFDCHFTTGDDGVTLKSGRNREGNELNRPNAFVRVTDCVSDGDFGFGTGSETAAGGHDLLFQNLTIKDVRCFGIWFKTLRWRGGSTYNVQIKDVMVDGANTAVRLSFDHSKGGPTNTVNPAAQPPQLYNVLIENVTGRNVQRGLWISGLPDAPIRGITVRGCSFDGVTEIVNGEDIVVE
ncbi:MAG: Ig-like domain-containing protein, partial [Firmicutes bacterium]|nr:Ig-like domain-containing protein [Bacillota bacterium]